MKKLKINIGEKYIFRIGERIPGPGVKVGESISEGSKLYPLFHGAEFYNSRLEMITKAEHLSLFNVPFRSVPEYKYYIKSKLIIDGEEYIQVASKERRTDLRHYFKSTHINERWQNLKSK